MSTSDQNEKKIHSNNRQEGTWEHSISGSEMKIKDGELHNRGGRGDSVPCVEDNTIRAMQIKSVLMQVLDWFDLENPTPLNVR